MLSGSSPAEYWHQLTGETLQRRLQQVQVEDDVLAATTGLPSDHLSPGFSLIVTVLSPFEYTGASAALRLSSTAGSAPSGPAYSGMY